MIRRMHASLVPVASAVLSMAGKDAPILCSGIAAHRIARPQLIVVGSKIEGKVHSRYGNPATVIGLTASIYCVYLLLSSDGVTTPATSRHADVAWFVENNMLCNSLVLAERILASSTPRRGFGGAPDFEVGAYEAELRAVQRALQAVKTATKLATQHGLQKQQTFDMQLSFFCKAAWPPNERVGSGTHDLLMERIQSPIFFTSQTQTQRNQHGAFGSVTHPGLVVPLSELSGVDSRTGSSENAGTSATDASSVATGSSLWKRSSNSNPSSGGRSGSVDGSELDVGPFSSFGVSDDVLG